MENEAKRAPVLGWVGRVISALLIAFLMFDAVTKIVRLGPVVDATQKLGFSAGQVPAIGFLLLACTVLYAIPRTAVLGAVLLTGYLGGATAIHVRAGSGTFPEVFTLIFGILTWMGLILLEPQLLRGCLLRK